MQLVADRFVVDDRGHAIDLATHDRVHLVSSSAGGAGEQAAWAERCAWFASLVHPSIAPLVDYGIVGESRRFEAWRVNPGWRGSNVAAEQAVMRSRRVLQANGRSSVGGLSVTLGCCGGRPVVIPDDCAGFPSNTIAEVADGGARDVLGILRRPDRRIASIADIIGAPAIVRMVALAIWAPAEGGIGAAVRLLARSARAAGFVPVCTTALDPAVRELVRGRTLMLLARDDVAGGWRVMLDLALDAAKPHVLIFAGAQPVRRVHVVSLERVPEESLVASVCPESARRRHLRHVAAAARRAQGLGTRFERLLFGAPPVAPDTRSRTHSYEDSMTTPSFQDVSAARAAENVSPAAVEHTLQPLIGDESGPVAGSRERRSEVWARGWPAPGELARLRRQVESARSLLGAGRYQPGERTARQAMHAFARRAEWVAAAESGVLLARSLMRRGRVDFGSAIVQTARTWADKARDLPLMQELALLEGEIRTQQGRLTEAELLLETAHAAAVSTENGGALASALALAECLGWQGRWGDAWQRLALAQPDAERSPRADARLRVVRSRVSIGRQRCAEAVADAARARAIARSLDDHQLLASALYACAFAQLAAGDAEQADSAARLAVASARQAHDPMLTLRLRLLRAEIGRRQGNRAPAALLVRRLGSAQAEILPLTIRARIDLLRDLLAATNDAESAQRRAEIAGLPGLRLFAPVPAPSPTSLTPAADDIVDLLRCCQVAEEDAAVLAAVCARLRARLRAHVVGFFATEGEDLVPLVSDGGRIDLATPRRVFAANQLVMPHHGGERVDAGVPVRYANQVIGVLAATWTPVAVWHAGDVSVLLSTGAAAAGPAVSGLVARRAASRHGRMSEMLGVSRSVAEVRAAIDRAASAPFPVLVHGASGSGKELVARLLHKMGARRDRPFSALNCAALPDDLVESELFGHARGAFTGALGERRGVFEDAHTGTLFLDEVGELSPRAQAKLLRAVQEGEIRRVGENVCRRVDVRLVTATNRDLHAEAAAGRFRADLLYRLDVIRIALPPLRERSEDIAVLAEHFWRDATERIGSRATLSAATTAALGRYEWPGNIRELQNVLAALAVRCPKRGAVPPSALPPHIADRSVPSSFRLEAARRTFDRGFICAALARCGGQRSRAAEELGVSRQGLAKLMARLSIEHGE